MLLVFHKFIPPYTIFINVTLSRKQLSQTTALGIVSLDRPSPKKEGFFFHNRVGYMDILSYIHIIETNKK